jgi:hypothetical protein
MSIDISIVPMAKKIISYVQTLGKKQYILAAVVVILGVGAAVATMDHNHTKLAPGIYLIGPSRNIKLLTPYTYRLEVVSPKTYNNATVIVGSGPARFSKVQQRVDLQANVLWISSSMTITFYNTAFMTSEGIQAGVNVPRKAGSLYYNNLFTKAFSLTPAPESQQPPSTRSATTTKISNSTKLPK